ncbi:MAG: DNA polymerase III subunit alpha [Alphaproteobacteria bacterium]|nr:DNA polymerase III subunit alpha [Alphaproteobacteria bacterium]
MAEAKFIHLRLHSSYSLCEGAIHLKKLPKLCRTFNMPAVALTDTNNVFGAPFFSKTCISEGIQPILGAQIDVPFQSQKSTGFSRKTLSSNQQTGQLVLLVQNETGYHNLNHILSEGYLSNDSFQVAIKNLITHQEGLICLTGGHNGILGKLLLLNRTEEAEKTLDVLHKYFGDRLYIELQRHGLEAQEKIEPHLIEFAIKKNIPLVATNEVFFAKKENYEAHDALLCVKDARYIDEDNRRKETKEHYLKSQEEMVELFKDLPEAIQNTVKIAKRCGYKVPVRDPLLPHAYEANDVSEDDILDDKARRGLQKKLEKYPTLDSETYHKQLEYELSVIKNMGFPGYFLIVSDFIKWAKYQQIPVGPGRGSGAGSVVAWSLKITDINPLEYGLIFERFLNPDRVSMPDFDIDFCQDRRHEVIKYVQEKYGTDKVAQIITFGELKARAVLRDVGRVLRMPYGHIDKICKFIPGNPGDQTTLNDALDNEKELYKEYESDDRVKKLFDLAIQLEGLHRHASVHAAGLLIGDRPLEQLVALYYDPRADMQVSQYNMKFIEDAGLVKYDFLGLKTLSIIDQCVKMIKKNHQEEIDISDIPMDDSQIYKTYARGDTIGLFQFESQGMQESLKSLKPTNFNDLVAMVALYRPGPMENIPIYIERKHGREKINYIHPLMGKSLDETFGILIYQEQVMDISRHMAGFTGGQADTLRKAMGKKIQSLMDELKPLFVNGCMSHSQIEKEIAEEIWHLMEKFASYGFNKAHSVCYALISYQTGYLKTHYRPEFMAASMNYDINNTDKLIIFINDIRKHKTPLCPPDINKSDATFIVKKGEICYALGALKNVGIDAMQSIVNERDKNGLFKSIPDFLARVNPESLNKRSLENLIKAGAFDKLDPSRPKLLGNIDLLLSHVGSQFKEKENKQTTLFFSSEKEPQSIPSFYQNLKKAPPLSVIEMIKLETEALGFYLTNHPLRKFGTILKKLSVKSTKDFQTFQNDTLVRLPCFIDNYTRRTTKKGNKMGILSLSDSFGAFETLLFSQELKNIEHKIKPKTSVLLTASVKKEGDRISLFTKDLEPLLPHVFQSISEVILPIKKQSVAQKLAPLLEQAGKGYTNILIKLKTKEKIVDLRLPRKIRLDEKLFETLERYVPDLEIN